MTVYLIRHAQSAFNAVYDRNKPDPMIYDAPITPLGESQALNAREEVATLDISTVIVSPFTRTLQTAHLIFGDALPFQINALVREQLCNSCDVGSTPGVLSEQYPHIDFSHLEDCWWHQGAQDHRGLSVESHEVLLTRTDAFAALVKREGWQNTAVVTHGNFIHALTGQRCENCEVVAYHPD